MFGGRYDILSQRLIEVLRAHADAGGGRRVLYRHRSEPIKVTQSYLAALAAEKRGFLKHSRLSMG